MPGIDDLKGLAAEMGLTGDPKPTPTPPAPEPTTTPEPTPTPTPEPQKTPDPVPPEPQKTPEPPKQAEPPIDNRAAAEARVQNKKYKDAIKAAAQAEGMSEDEYLVKLQEAALQKRATEQNVPPEILRRLEATEAELAQSREAMAQQHLSLQFGNLQNKFGLSNEKLTEFVNKLADNGHNFQNTHADYELLYRGMYHTELLEQERQKWIADASRSQASGSTPPSRGGKSASTGGSKLDSMDGLNAVLDEWQKK